MRARPVESARPQGPPEPPEMIGVAEVAAELGLSPRKAFATIRRLGVLGLIPARNPLRDARFARADWEAARDAALAPIGSGIAVRAKAPAEDPNTGKSGNKNPRAARPVKQPKRPRQPAPETAAEAGFRAARLAFLARRRTRSRKAAQTDPPVDAPDATIEGMSAQQADPQPPDAGPAKPTSQ